jgi:hypothetical protein
MFFFYFLPPRNFPTIFLLSNVENNKARTEGRHNKCSQLMGKEGERVRQQKREREREKNAPPTAVIILQQLKNSFIVLTSEACSAKLFFFGINRYSSCVLCCKRLKRHYDYIFNDFTSYNFTYNDYL